MEPIGSKPIDELIILARNGNGPAFTALWDTYIGQLRGYIRSWLKNLSDFDVDDICSRSFEKAFRQIGSYDSSKAQFSTWLRTIARNTALDVIDIENRLHPKGQIEYLDDNAASVPVDIEEDSANPLDSIINDEIETRKLLSIDALPDLYRDVARLRLIEGQSYKDIADHLNMELNTVKTRLRRAKAMIASMAEELADKDE